MYCSQDPPTAFFNYIAHSRLITTNLYAQLYNLSMSGVYFLRFLKAIFLLSPFESLHHSLFYLPILFLTFLSSTMFQMHL